MNKYGGFTVEIDPRKSSLKKIDYLSDRVPDLFKKIIDK